MSLIQRAGLVGGGVIGAGWAARLILNGIDVAVYDPDPEIARKLETVLANARRAWARLMPDAILREGRLTVARSIAEAVADAEFIQESLPEVESLKQRVLVEIEAAARPDAIIASSTSGLLPTRLQAGMQRPDRFVVGHPFNPVYLLPLVEVCGGERTAEATKERVAALYAEIGMRPLHVRKEVDGFIADRLLEALWREALWLVNDGIATTEEIDDAVRYGAGLRWSFMGTFLIYRLAGGEAGMRHFMSQFGPALKLPWTKLVAPELTDDLLEAVVAQSDDQAAGVSIRELEVRRDDCLIAVLSGLRGQDYGAGATLAAFHKRLVDRNGRAAAAAVDPSRPLALHVREVQPDWVDYNGHMTEYRYLQVLGEATDATLSHIGADAAYLAAGRSYYTAETHIRHLAQCHQGDRLAATTMVLHADAKRLHLFHRLTRISDGILVATGEHMMLHVDARSGTVVPCEGAMLATVSRLAEAHARLERPEGAGRAVGQPR